MYRRLLEDPFLQTIKDVATKDEDYMIVLNHLKSNTSTKDLRKQPTTSPVPSYLAVWKRLGILDNETKSLMTINNSHLHSGLRGPHHVD